ncbi:hypothetical protein J7L36_00305, partial [bacterium]|nr:hypothetical protein [bacterium]
QIVGHQKQWEFLKKSAQLDKISHAYLFSGEEKLGKRTVALKWISFLRKIPIKTQDPDLVFVEPQNNIIQISQIRNLIQRLSLSPMMGSFKIGLLNDAHLMARDAQNALLKILEEPKRAVLILITSKPEILYPTVVSRCETIKFYPVPIKEIEEYLLEKGLSKKKAEYIAQISEGKPGKAIEFLLNPEKLEERKKLIFTFNEISQSPFYFRFKIAKELAKRDELPEILEIWLEFQREKLLQNLNFQQNQAIKEVKKNIELLEKINYLISTTNINQKLALEFLFINICKNIKT